MEFIFFAVFCELAVWTMSKKTLREVRVKDVEKRRFPNKHYVRCHHMTSMKGANLPVSVGTSYMRTRVWLGT